MARSYRHIKEYEKEILEMKQEGITNREIAEKFGLTVKQIKNFINRRNHSQIKLEAGATLKKRGRPAKDCVVSEEDKIADLKYKLVRKDARIKQLEMENELMRDFLSLTGRK